MIGHWSCSPTVSRTPVSVLRDEDAADVSMDRAWTGALHAVRAYASPRPPGHVDVSTRRDTPPIWGQAAPAPDSLPRVPQDAPEPRRFRGVWLTEWRWLIASTASLPVIGLGLGAWLQLRGMVDPDPQHWSRREPTLLGTGVFGRSTLDEGPSARDQDLANARANASLVRHRQHGTKRLRMRHCARSRRAAWCSLTASNGSTYQM